MYQHYLFHYFGTLMWFLISYFLELYFLMEPLQLDKKINDNKEIIATRFIFIYLIHYKVKQCFLDLKKNILINIHK